MKNGSYLFFALLALPGVFTAHVRAQTPAAGPTTPAPSSAPAAPAAASATPQAIDPAKVAEIRKMLELTGIAKMLQPMVGQLLNAYKLRNTDISDEFWDNYEKQIDYQSLEEKMIPLYDKYYTLDDLKAVNTFYETPAGQRVLAATPLIMHEGMQVGQDWGREVGAKLAADLSKERAREAAAATPTAAAASAAASTIAPAPSTAPAPAVAPASPPPSQ